MQMPNDHFDVEDLICNASFQRYCLGCNLNEHIIWQEWMERLPHRQADIEEAKRLVGILSVKQGSRIVQLKELKSGLHQKDLLGQMLSLEEPVTEVAPVFKRKSSFFYSYGAAATFFIAILSVYFYFNSFKTKVHSNVTGENFASGRALRKTIVLNDGTVITMARESNIRLQSGFSKTKRELWLSGEAFFDVKHDAAHPFIVHTSLNDIKVLGTTFNVKAYPKTTMETVLIKGSVRVDSKQHPGYYVILKPNQKLVSLDFPQKASAEALKKEYKVSTLNTSGASVAPEETQWVRKRLDIDDLPLSVIAQKLQDWYGISIVIKDDQVKDYHYSGVFENETVVKTLEALQLSYPFRFEIAGNQILITK